MQASFSGFSVQVSGFRVDKLYPMIAAGSRSYRSMMKMGERLPTAIIG
jgi:hypothetical protein